MIALDFRKSTSAPRKGTGYPVHGRLKLFSTSGCVPLKVARECRELKINLETKSNELSNAIA